MWKTRFTKRFPSVTVPIMGAPMAGVSGGALAAETCRAGAMGFIGGGHLDNLTKLRQEIQLFRERTRDFESQELAIGFIGHSSLRSGNPDRVEQVLKEYKPSVVQFCAPAVAKLHSSDNPTVANNIDLAHKYGCHVMVQVGTIAEAKEALDAGVDTVIAQGREAGGHGMRPDLGNGTLALSAHIVSLTKTAFSDNEDKRPLVLAAGGIVNGNGLAAALALGCDGVVMGTRLWASQEAMGHESFKERLASPNAGPDEVIRTTVVDQVANTFLGDPWPSPYDSTGNLRNKTTEAWHGHEKELEKRLSQGGDLATEYKLAVTQGDPEIAAVYSGEGVGDIHSIDPAYDIIRRTSDEGMAIVRNMSAFIVS